MWVRACVVRMCLSYLSSSRISNKTAVSFVPNHVVGQTERSRALDSTHARSTAAAIESRKLCLSVPQNKNCVTVALNNKNIDVVTLQLRYSCR